jgi:hypothetical protein
MPLRPPQCHGIRHATSLTVNQPAIRAEAVERLRVTVFSLRRFGGGSSPHARVTPAAMSSCSTNHPRLKGRLKLANRAKLTSRPCRAVVGGHLTLSCVTDH